MTDQITSGELRGFVADNTGRRKIDTEASMELHVRAATQIDALSHQVAELNARVADAEAAAAAAQSTPAAPAAQQDPTDAAMMLLRNAQTAADQTIAEAERIKAEAASALDVAQQAATAEADRQLTDAREQAQAIIAAANEEAAQALVDANARAASMLSANEKALDRADFIQRQYVEKASTVRQEAEALVEFSRQVESLAGTDLTIPDLPEEFAQLDSAPKPPPPVAEPFVEAPQAAAPVAEPSPFVEEAPAEEAVAEAPHVEAPPAPAAEITPDIAVFDQEVASVEPNSSFLPPPPPPAAIDILDLSESDLEGALDSSDDIDDDLFGEADDDVIDLRDEADKLSEDLQFFGKA